MKYLSMTEAIGVSYATLCNFGTDEWMDVCLFVCVCVHNLVCGLVH